MGSTEQTEDAQSASTAGHTRVAQCTCPKAFEIEALEEQEGDPYVLHSPSRLENYKSLFRSVPARSSPPRASNKCSRAIASASTRQEDGSGCARIVHAPDNRSI